MTAPYHVTKPDALMQRIATWIGYAGRTFKIIPAESVHYSSYWSGGSKDTYYMVSLRDDYIGPLPSNHPVFDPKTPDTIALIPSYMIVVHSIFCGKDMGLSFYVHPDALSKLNLPAPATLTRDEQIVLAATRSLKNTYSGRTNIRFTEAHRDTGITEDAWLASQTSLRSRGMLNSANAITPEGRNAIGQTDLYSLKERT